MLKVWLTHPTAIFVEDVKVAPPKAVEKEADKSKTDKKPEEETPQVRAAPDVEIQAGMVVSLGPDAARLSAKFIKYLEEAKEAGVGRRDSSGSRSTARPGIATRRPSRATRMS